jgi:hypothetical protein
MIDDPAAPPAARFRTTRARTHAQEAKVARDFADFDGEAAQRARVREHVAHALRHPEQIPGRLQRQTRGAGERRDHQLAVLVAGVEARADRRRADVQFLELLGALRDILSAAPHAFRVAAELLPKGDRHRVLQMRAPGLEHVHELVALACQAVCQRAAATSGPAPISSASRVAVGNTSFVDCPMLT